MATPGAGNSTKLNAPFGATAQSDGGHIPIPVEFLLRQIGQ
jgi:hypothetical protein